MVRSDGNECENFLNFVQRMFAQLCGLVGMHCPCFFMCDHCSCVMAGVFVSWQDLGGLAGTWESSCAYAVLVSIET